MKAMRFHSTGGPEVLRCDEVPLPEPGPGQVRLRIDAAGVNYGDVIRRRGDPYPFPTPLPYTPGGECVGVVEAVGASVDGVALPPLLGRRFLAFTGSGCYAEHVLATPEQLFEPPAGLAPATAIALFVQGLSTALILRHAGRLARGDAVLVQAAAGGVGLLALQLARLWGAGFVVALASQDSKRALALAHGADLAVDYTQPGWHEAVRAAAPRGAIDLVLEMTGGEVAQASLALLGPFGRAVVYGGTANAALALDTQALPPRNLSVVGFFMRPYLRRRALIDGLLRELGGFVADGRLKVHVGGEFALADAAEAHRRIEARTATGKLVLRPGTA